MWALSKNRSIMQYMLAKRCPAMVGHLCYVYMFGAENADTEEAVEATVSSESPSPLLRLKLVPLNAADNLSISLLTVWSTMRA